MDYIYEYSGNEQRHIFEMPLLLQVQISLHTLFCSDCSQKIELYRGAREMLRKDFFPPVPNLEDSIMARISVEEQSNPIYSETENTYAIPGGIPTRGWVIAGIIVVVSLVTTFFGLDYQSLVIESGTSFLLPLGITIGIVLTTYGVFFIGSHLKELSERFGL
jgi:hypothetical protein